MNITIPNPTHLTAAGSQGTTVSILFDPKPIAGALPVGWLWLQSGTRNEQSQVFTAMQTEAGIKNILNDIAALDCIGLDSLISRIKSGTSTIWGIRDATKEIGMVSTNPEVHNYFSQQAQRLKLHSEIRLMHDYAESVDKWDTLSRSYTPQPEDFLPINGYGDLNTVLRFEKHPQHQKIVKAFEYMINNGLSANIKDDDTMNEKFGPGGYWLCCYYRSKRIEDSVADWVKDRLKIGERSKAGKLYDQFRDSRSTS